MAAMNGCPYCDGWKRWNDLSCDKCSGRSGRRGYNVRTLNLSVNIREAALEEMRVRAAVARMEASHGRP